MGTLNDTLRKVSADYQAKQIAEIEAAAQAHAELVRDRAIKYAADVYGHASAYDNAIVIAGYAAFFALWAGVAEDVSRNCRLVTATLMGVSLLLYITWHVMQMLTRQRFEFARAETFAFADDAVRFNAEWEKIEQRQAIAQQQVMRFWLPIFVPTLALGIIGGLTLAYNTLATMFDWWRVI